MRRGQKLVGLERSVARQDETLKAVQDSLLAARDDVKAVSERMETMQGHVNLMSRNALLGIQVFESKYIVSVLHNMCYSQQANLFNLIEPDTSSMF